MCETQHATQAASKFHFVVCLFRDATTNNHDREDARPTLFHTILLQPALVSPTYTDTGTLLFTVLGRLPDYVNGGRNTLHTRTGKMIQTAKFIVNLPLLPRPDPRPMTR